MVGCGGVRCSYLSVGVFVLLLVVLRVLACVILCILHLRILFLVSIYGCCCFVDDYLLLRVYGCLVVGGFALLWLGCYGLCFDWCC